MLSLRGIMIALWSGGRGQSAMMIPRRERARNKISLRSAAEPNLFVLKHQLSKEQSDFFDNVATLISGKESPPIHHQARDAPSNHVRL